MIVNVMGAASDLRASRGGDHVVDIAVDDKSPLVSTLSLYSLFSYINLW